MEFRQAIYGFLEQRPVGLPQGTLTLAWCDRASGLLAKAAAEWGVLGKASAGALDASPLVDELLALKPDFAAMGGYALYVWGSYAVTGVLMLIEPWLAARRHHAARRAAATLPPPQARFGPRGV